MFKKDVSASILLESSVQNNTHEYLNNIRSSIMNTQNNLAQDNNTENKNHSYLFLVKHLEERINSLKDKIKHQKYYKIDVKNLNKLKQKDFLNILEMMNFKLDGLWNSCKLIRSKLLTTFMDWSVKIINEFQSVYESILQVKTRRIIVNTCKKKKNHITFDLVIQANIIGKLAEQTVGLVSVNKYFYSEDFYKNWYQFDVGNNNSITRWVMKEFTYFHDDNLQKAYTQPIINFREKDQIEINVNLVSQRGVIKIESFKWLFPQISKIPKEETEEGYREVIEFDLSRKCEVEFLKNKWSDIVLLENKFIDIKFISDNFSDFFEIEKILFDDVGYFIFKIFLKAVKAGQIIYNDILGISIVIKEEESQITNEVKKNFLIFDRSNQIEIRVGDNLIFYYSMNKKMEK